MLEGGKLFTKFDSIRTYFNTLIQRKSFKYGLPFILFVVGGSFGLREWTQIRLLFLHCNNYFLNIYRTTQSVNSPI